MGFDVRWNRIHWKANFIEIPSADILNVKNDIKLCGDDEDPYSPYSKWGTYFFNNSYYIVPYIFSINILRKLAKFVDEYLELLGYPSFFESQKLKDDKFTKSMDIFKKRHLGF